MKYGQSFDKSRCAKGSRGSLPEDSALLLLLLYWARYCYFSPSRLDASGGAPYSGAKSKRIPLIDEVMFRSVWCLLNFAVLFLSHYRRFP